MKLENYEVHLPSYSIGNTIYDKIGPVCESYGKTVLVIGGRQALDAALDKIRAAVEQTNLKIIGVELFGQDCTYANVERLRAMPIYHEADMVFGVGGGKALDTVKCLCITDDKPVFTFPTIASNCSACTAVSIMYNEDGTYIDNIGTIDHHLQHVLHSFVHAVPLAAIRKRVRGYVQYAHNQGSAANFQLLAILPCILPICFTQYICHFSHIQLPITFHTSIVIL